jgi:ABC-type transport system involved in Fe-S cluster assembly fused permease/ATPase subunit
VCSHSIQVYIVGGFFFHVYILLTLVQWSNAPNIAHCVVWLLTLLGEAMILVTEALGTFARHRNIRHVGLRGDEEVTVPDKYDRVDLVTATVRLFLTASLLSLYASIATKRYRKERHLLAEEGRQSDSDEESPLLGAQDISYHTQGLQNGSHHTSAKAVSDGDSDQQEEDAAFYRPDKLPHKNWWEYCRGYSVFFPYLWPHDSLKLQLVVLICVILVIFQRVVNVLVPLQYGKITNLLAEENEFGHHMPWGQMCLLILYKLLQGNSGLIGSIRAILWVPVSQHTYRALTTAAFEHVHSLSLDFHLGKRTGEVLSALNKGSAINTFLEQVTFFVLPMVFDLFVAIVLFYYEFGPIYALAVSIVTFYYLYVSVQMAQTRVDQRRDMVNADREEEAVKNDSITSYETVKYFNAERREFQRYRNAIKTYQEAEANVTYGIQHMNMAQTAVFMAGIFTILVICGYEVANGTRKVGVFVSLMSYLNQLQGPLNFFGSFYRTIQQAMVSGERLLELFKIQPSVIDRPGVEDLPSCQGHIRWNNVKFSYDRRKPALRDLSFECAPGTTTAFVGESGGGKSTVFRLMFRFYNCQEGSIEVDGHDVKDVTIDSVRRNIGVVPQDTILFNETLMYNLQYANPDATEEDVYEACRAAAIHDRIMGFPDKYNTKVGERGLRLSGGEKQRVAIARTILKKPKIIMLDEATSALDGETEQKIQSKLISGNLGQDRTLLIIA